MHITRLIMKFSRLFVFLLACVFVSSASISVFGEEGIKENKKIKISDEYYFKYSFANKPKIGQSVIKVEIFDKNDNKTSNLKLIGSYDMPSMRGHHSSGDVDFKLNKNNDYLMPISFVMRGGWEIVLTFQEDDKVVCNTSINVNV